MTKIEIVVAVNSLTTLLCAISVLIGQIYTFRKVEKQAKQIGSLNQQVFNQKCIIDALNKEIIDRIKTELPGL